MSGISGILQIDLTAPMVICTSLQDEQIIKQEIWVNGTAIDSFGELKRVQFYFDDSSFRDYSLNHLNSFSFSLNSSHKNSS